MNPYPKQEQYQYESCTNSEGTRVLLDHHNSDLNFVIERDGLTGSTLYKNGFEYLWAGARATHGVRTGKVFYEVVVQEKLEVDLTDSKSSANVMRVGWSVDSSDLSVGEAPLSYGYGGTGKSSCNNKFYNYGERYGSNDVITCYIDLNAVPKAIFFAKNGKYLGVAFSLGPEADGKVFYPHVSAKNMRFLTNFGGLQPYFPPVPEFSFIECLPPNLLCVPAMSPHEIQNEILMMVGLPSCGKTTWLEKFVRDNPEKKYYILGTNEILRKMKVMGLSRKRNYHGRWDALIKQATGILNEMLKIAQRKRLNYILDQTNVYASARRRKISNFRNYKHIAVVIVNTNDVLMSRNQKVVREDGKVIPESAFMEMKSNFVLPVEGQVFDEVWYVEEDRERSMELVAEFNHEGRTWKKEQEKRPADESVNEPLGAKKPKYEAPGGSKPPDQHHSDHSQNRWTHGSDSYRNNYGPQPNNPQVGPLSPMTGGPRQPPPRHQNQFSHNNSQYNRARPGEAYYPSPGDRQGPHGEPSLTQQSPTQQPYPQEGYRQSYPHQPQYSQSQMTQIPKPEFPQTYHQPYNHRTGGQGYDYGAYSSQTAGWYGPQSSSSNKQQNYYGQDYQPVKQENWSGGQHYNQGQYRNYQQYQ